LDHLSGINAGDNCLGKSRKKPAGKRRAGMSLSLEANVTRIMTLLISDWEFLCVKLFEEM